MVNATTPWNDPNQDVLADLMAAAELMESDEYMPIFPYVWEGDYA